MTLLRALPFTLSLSLCACELNSEKPVSDGPGNDRNSGAQVLPGHAVQSAQYHLPAWSGGNLHIVGDRLAVVADADRDQVHVLDLETKEVLHHVSLNRGDEPGRLASDAEGHVYVALRRSGAVVVIDPAAGSVLSRFDVCAAPRGVAFDESRARLIIACADGLLAFWDRSGGTLTHVELDKDLRDVVILEGGIAVSRFRSAEVLMLDPEGKLKQRVRPTTQFDTAPTVAWRTIASPDRDSVLVLHQLAQTSEVSIQPGGYGGFGCSVVSSVVTEIGADGVSRAQAALGATLVMDIAVAEEGQFTAVTPAEMEGRRPASVSGNLDELPPGTNAHHCDFGGEVVIGGNTPGSYVAVAYRVDGTVVRLSQDPPVVEVQGRVIPFAAERLVDTGLKLFHMDAGGGVACASCHPEGGDDGHVWHFEELGPRRSQTIHSGLLGSEPFHWNGDMPNFQHLVSEVFQSRMGGGQMNEEQVTALSRWIDRIPGPPPPRRSDDAEVAIGKTLFERADVGCVGCHNGPRMSGAGAFDVGTGLVLEVPALVGVAYRAPFLHDGCAPTLLDRFRADCGGGDRHGRTSQLAPEEVQALVAYLESL